MLILCYAAPHTPKNPFAEAIINTFASSVPGLVPEQAQQGEAAEADVQQVQVLHGSTRAHQDAEVRAGRRQVLLLRREAAIGLRVPALPAPAGLFPAASTWTPLSSSRWGKCPLDFFFPLP